MRMICWFWRQAKRVQIVESFGHSIRNDEIKQLSQLVAFQAFQSVFNILVAFSHVNPTRNLPDTHLWLTI
jgi:hypothetical protein